LIRAIDARLVSFRFAPRRVNRPAVPVHGHTYFIHTYIHTYIQQT